jgi:hypothetical protein
MGKTTCRVEIGVSDDAERLYGSHQGWRTDNEVLKILKEAEANGHIVSFHDKGMWVLTPDVSEKGMLSDDDPGVLVMIDDAQPPPP